MKRDKETSMYLLQKSHELECVEGIISHILLNQVAEYV